MSNLNTETMVKEIPVELKDEQKPKAAKADKQEAKLLEEKLEARFDWMKTQLKEWGIDLELFSHRAKKAGGELRAEYDHQVEELRPKLDEAKKQLKYWKKEGVSASDEVLKGVEKAWAELSVAFAHAAEKFRKHEANEEPVVKETAPKS